MRAFYPDKASGHIQIAIIVVALSLLPLANGFALSDLGFLALGACGVWLLVAFAHMGEKELSPTLAIRPSGVFAREVGLIPWSRVLWSHGSSSPKEFGDELGLAFIDDQGAASWLPLPGLAASKESLAAAIALTHPVTARKATRTRWGFLMLSVREETIGPRAEGAAPGGEREAAIAFLGPILDAELVERDRMRFGKAGAGGSRARRERACASQTAERLAKALPGVDVAARTLAGAALEGAKPLALDGVIAGRLAVVARLRWSTHAERLEAGLWAELGAAELWLVDKAKRRVTVCRDPQHGFYTSVARTEGDATLSPLDAPSVALRACDLA